MKKEKMLEIRKATIGDEKAINDITKRAFVLYKDELNVVTKVKALTESDEDIINDIENNHVYIAVSNGEIVGAIRFCALTNALAYVYRFAVDPSIKDSGVGSQLLNFVINECEKLNFSAISLHTNSKYYQLARYYYGKQFFVHSTDTSKGYIRALFIKELNKNYYDIAPAFNK